MPWTAWAIPICVGSAWAQPELDLGQAFAVRIAGFREQAPRLGRIVTLDIFQQIARVSGEVGRQHRIGGAWPWPCRMTRQMVLSVDGVADGPADPYVVEGRGRGPEEEVPGLEMGVGSQIPGQFGAVLDLSQELGKDPLPVDLVVFVGRDCRDGCRR